MSSDTTQAALDAAASAASAGTAAAMGSKIGWSGLGLGGFGWLLTSEAGVAMGILVGISGFSVSWYYRRKEFQLKLAQEARDREAHELRMSLMRRGAARRAHGTEAGQ